MYACIYVHGSIYDSTVKPASDSATEAILLDFAVGFSPLVELSLGVPPSSSNIKSGTAAGMVITGSAGATITLDISGTETLFGPPESLAQEIVDRAQAIGLAVNVAVADNPDAAILIARNVEQTVSLPPGESSARRAVPGAVTTWSGVGQTVSLPPGESSARRAVPGAVATGSGVGQTVSLPPGESSARRAVPGAVTTGFIPEVQVSTDPIQHPANTRGVIIVPPDKTSSVLSPLPLEALDPALTGIEPGRAAEIIETLRLWGLETLGDFAALPEKGVGETLGQPGLKFQKLARGTNRRSLRYRIPKREFRQSMDLESPIELVEQLSFVVSGLLHQLCTRLGEYGLAMIEIRLEARLDDKSSYFRKLRLPFPMSSPQWLSRLVIMDVEACPPTTAIESVSIEVEPVKPRPLQKGLFEPLTPEPEKLELTLARLARLVGADNVGAPVVLNTHRPDAFRLKSFALSKKPAALNFSTPQTRSLLTLRMFRPPVPVEVKTTPSASCLSASSCTGRPPCPPSNSSGSTSGTSHTVPGAVATGSTPVTYNGLFETPSVNKFWSVPGAVLDVDHAPEAAQTLSLRPFESRAESLPRPKHSSGAQSTLPHQDSVRNSPNSKLTVCSTEEPVATAPVSVGPVSSRKGGLGTLVQDTVPLVQDARPPLQGSAREVNPVATAPPEVAQTVSLRPLESRANSLSEPKQHLGGEQSMPLSQDLVCNSPSSKLTVCSTSDPVATAPPEVAQTVSLRPLELPAHSSSQQPSREYQSAHALDAAPCYQDSVCNSSNSKLTVCSTEEPIRPIHLKLAFRQTAKQSTKQSGAASGRIVYDSGPWHISGDWWSISDNWVREEWDVALSNGTFYKIFRDLSTGGWFVEGIYD